MATQSLKNFWKIPKPCDSLTVKIWTDNAGINLSKSILSGDSGGPYYQWFDTENGGRVAYIIGVVSRGKGCANFNSPGIFTRITKHLKWIKKHTRSGDC